METAARVWTVADVRAEMPDVVCLVDDKILPGVLSGRMNRFASVRPIDGRHWCAFEFAWETVVHCLNNGRPLRIN
jgi:hypothetical protein